MQQRRLRLGDILDDYCPRERRITNHAVVAMIEDQVKQTRCTTCDADHEYKEARVPVRRRKDVGILVAGAGAAGPLRRPAVPAVPASAGEVAHAMDAAADAHAPQVADVVAALGLDAPALEDRLDQHHDELHVGAEPDDAELAPRTEEDGPVHRRLIRATLPRPEGATPEWKDPEFTIRQPAGRNGGRHRRPMRAQGGPGSGQQPARFGNQQRHGHGGNTRQGGHGHGNVNGNRGGGRPGHGQPGQHRGPRQGGQGRKRGR